MRSIQQIRNARSLLVRQILNAATDEQQRVLLQGMSVALQWVCGEGGSSLGRLLSGEPIANRDVVDAATDRLVGTPAGMEGIGNGN